MVYRRVWVAVAALALLSAVPAHAQLQTSIYAQGLDSPVAFVQDPSDPTVQYVVEQPGSIRVIKNGALQGTPFLDLSPDGANLVEAGGERGLLTLAFPPNYGTSGRFYVFYTRRSDNDSEVGDIVISRYLRSANPLLADPGSRKDLVWPGGLAYVDHPLSNHNGGKLLFGADGYLYIAHGDGGGGGDTELNAQNPNTLKGKILRIDVSDACDSTASGYCVPPDNPFVDDSPISALDEIWAFGLRNPWRVTMDPPALGGTGALLIGDVGQGAWEEVDYEPAGQGGRNYGWARREGANDYDANRPVAYTPLTEPIYNYPNPDVGQAITGGYIYRGALLGPSYVGRYFFADGSNGHVFSLALTINGTTGEATASDFVDHTDDIGGSGVSGPIVSIDIDSQGELYLVSLSGRVYKLSSPNSDTDSDGLPSAWEVQFGLDPNSSSGDNGASGDPDGDGISNQVEFQSNTHPRGNPSLKRYLAEGATGNFFDTRFAVFNPGTSSAAVLFRFTKSDGSVVTQFLNVPAASRRTVVAESLSGLSAAEFSTSLETDNEVVLDRLMTWDDGGYGSHAERSVPTPNRTWYLAEGATHSGFELFYLLQNPDATQAANVTVRYLLPNGAPIERTYNVPPGSRQTIWVDLIPELADTDVSGVVEVTSGPPIIVERAMYLTGGGQLFRAGHESAGVTAPATDWFLAEGATGDYFDLFILIENPNSSPASVEATYLLVNGTTVVKTYPVAANSRFNIWVDLEGPELANAAVSTRLRSLNGVSFIVERSMWWPFGSANWFEAHNSAGSTVSGTRWATAEGEVGGSSGTETFLLIANTSAAAASVRVSLFFEDGTASVNKTYSVVGNSRFNVPVGEEFPGSQGKRFGALIESLGGSAAQIVVERAIYSSPDGVTWTAGSDALATRLTP